MITLLHITTVPITLGFLRGHVAFVREHDFDVHILSSPGRLLDRFATEIGVSAWAVPMSRRITPVADLFALFRIWQYIRLVQPHIVHAHTPKGGLLGMIAAWLAGVPVRVYHIHGLPLVTATGLRRHLLWMSEWLSCHLSHQVLCVSDSVCDVAIKQGICPAERIEVLGSGSIGGVDARHRFNPASYDCVHVRKQYELPQDALVVGYVGRVVHDKGIVELAQAWQTLRAEFENLHLLVVGPFEPQDPIPEYVRHTLRNDARVHLIGWTDDVSSLYAMMDLLILPTHREGFGLVAIEAAAMALPTVATRIPGCIDAVEDGVTGTLVPPRDVDALTNAVRDYLRDEDLRHRHGSAGRERVLRDFRPETLWEAMYQKYLSLLQKRGILSPDQLSSASVYSGTHE